jgi:hypothetical protein
MTVVDETQPESSPGGPGGSYRMTPDEIEAVDRAAIKVGLDLFPDALKTVKRALEEQHLDATLTSRDIVEWAIRLVLRI